jgi:hypothetical protein
MAKIAELEAGMISARTEAGWHLRLVGASMPTSAMAWMASCPRRATGAVGPLQQVNRTILQASDQSLHLVGHSSESWKRSGIGGRQRDRQCVQ